MERTHHPASERFFNKAADGRQPQEGPNDLFRKTDFPPALLGLSMANSFFGRTYFDFSPFQLVRLSSNLPVGFIRGEED